MSIQLFWMRCSTNWFGSTTKVIFFLSYVLMFSSVLETKITRLNRFWRCRYFFQHFKWFLLKIDFRTFLKLVKYEAEKNSIFIVQAWIIYTRKTFVWAEKMYSVNNTYHNLLPNFKLGSYFWLEQFWSSQQTLFNQLF